MKNRIDKISSIIGFLLLIVMFASTHTKVSALSVFTTTPPIQRQFPLGNVDNVFVINLNDRKKNEHQP